MSDFTNLFMSNESLSALNDSVIDKISKLFNSAEMLRINVWLKRCKETIKPWSEFMNMDKFKQPIDKNQCLARVRRNLDHFRSNYLILFVFLALYCILTSPLILVLLISVSIACYFIHIKQKEGICRIMEKDFKIDQLYIGLGLISVPLFLLAGFSSLVFYIIGVTVSVSLIHAAYYSSEQLEQLDFIESEF